MTTRIRPNLALVVFGPKAVYEDKALFNELRNISQTRDDGTPISVPEIQASIDKSEKNKLYSQISSIIQSCTRLKLEIRLYSIEPEPTYGVGGPGIAAPVAAYISYYSL
ncbi:hypothetical protein B0I37DRAFT_391781 [Chaetomium sp. MPI-CAGE-AT-0009]|nr:hypothetical protein B0I37DRAFT_391781 [Chaetomium sp. MPI-CAGE-AT-0009]